MKTKKVCIYTRCSTSMQSTEMQVNELTQYANARGWDIVKIYEETASGKKDNRQKLTELMGQARQREFDILLIWKLDRLGRSLKHLVTTLDELTELNIEFCSMKDSIDCTTSAGRLMLNLLGAMAQFERELIVERVRSGLNNARRKGVKLGRRHEYDYAEIRDLKSQGKTYKQIRQRLKCSNGVITSALNSRTENPESL